MSSRTACDHHGACRTPAPRRSIVRLSVGDAPSMIAIVFAAALVASACDVRVSDKGVSVDVAKGKVTDEWSRSYTIASGGRLEIVNVNGDIEVTPADGSTVEVEATRDARAGSDDAARELLRQVQIVEQVAPDHVKVEVRSEAQGNRLGRSRVSVEYRV